ncbi:HK97 family phage prohead protease [Paenibacillus sp. FSL R5-808]|uniref:HK97 family phage prohead protease n=1 Tax=Paenibacillus sp. FSL R5-808 TaxID=1227076 RepID=UPI0003E291AC|nr:phage prohead protease HK97 family protein [Paenibacillus sp. FSL R5-808]
MEELEKKIPTNEPEKRALPITYEIRESEDGKEVRTVVGSIKYNSESRVMKDWYGDEFVEIIAPGAFSEYMKENNTISLWCHRTDQILGNTKPNTLRLFDGPTELRFELDLPHNSWGDDAHESIQRGDVDGVSFGFNIRTNGDRWSKIERDGKTLYQRTVLVATLPEISMTPFAAYPENEVAVRSLEEFKAEETRAALNTEKEELLMELDLI